MAFPPPHTPTSSLPVVPSRAQRARRRVRRGLLVLVTGGTTLGLLAGSALAGVEGVDVSRYQHPSGEAIDFTAARGAGQSFTVVKATEGRGYVSSPFAADFAAARRAGLVRGAYHFARPDTDSGDAAAEARHFVDVVRGAGGFGSAHTLPPVLDLEANGGLSAAQLVSWTRTWLTTVEKLTGRPPVIYTGPAFWRASLGDSTAFGRYPLWIAHYTTASAPSVPRGWSRYTLWQYTSAGKVPGIAGRVDRNRFHGAPADLAALSRGTRTRLSLVAPARVLVGDTARVAGTLSTAAGTSLGGRTVRVYRRAPGTTAWTRTATVRTAADGGYALDVAPSGDAEYTARYAGDIMRRRASADVSAMALASLRTTHLSLAAGAPKVTYGKATRLRGTLRADGAGRMSGAAVTIKRRAAGAASWTRVSTVTTGARGGYTVSVRPRRNITFRALYAGNATHRKASGGQVVVRVARSVSAAFSAPRPRVHTTTYLTGRVTPTRAGAPVYRQRYSGGGWHRVATRRLTSTGRYRFAVTPGRRVASRYRVVVPAGGGLTTGVSRARVLRPR